jgi:hypothetical protein
VLSPNRRRYLVFQFAVAVVMSLLIANWFAESGGSAVLIPCVLLWIHLYSLGLLNDGRASATGIELLRLILVVPVGAIAVDASLSTASPAFWTMLATYTVVSVLWLRRS